MPKISVVVPVYGCGESLPSLYERLNTSLSEISEDFEVVLVNDASPDKAWETIKTMVARDNRIKGINLTRNFGQHRAIAAGLAHVQGEWTVVMDCDLQDRPEDILTLYQKAQEGYDAVFGQRINRQHSKKKKFASRLFIALYDYLTDSKTDPSIGNFSIVSKKVVEGFNALKEQHRPYTFFVIWLGYKRTYIEIEHAPRQQGKSAYTFRRLVSLAMDNIASQSNKLLKISIKFGFALSFFSAVYASYLMVRHFFDDEVIPGWTSVMVSIYFIAGLLFANLGLIGFYLGKIFDESKNRPLYIIDEII